MKTHTIEFRQLIVNHTYEYMTPQDYDLAPSAFPELIIQKMKEVDADTPHQAGDTHTYAGLFLINDEDVRDFFMDELGFDPVRVQKMSDDRVWELYRHFIGKAFTDLAIGRLTPEQTHRKPQPFKFKGDN